MKWAALLLALVAAGEAARILAVFPVVSKSHYTVGRKIMLAMCARGHQVTMISPYEDKNPPQGWRFVKINITSFADAIPNMPKEIDTEKSFFMGQFLLWASMNMYTNYITKLTEFRHFIDNDKSEFDLVITEAFFSQALYPFAFKYNAPLVLLSTFGPGHFLNEHTGNALEISSVPHEFSAKFGKMDFLERVQNLIYTVYDLIGRKYVSLSYQNGLARELFGHLDGLPHVEELERNASLLLINSHHSVAIVQPFLPNIVEIAGIHIEDVVPLDGSLKSLLDNAKSGVVLFSFGSVIQLNHQSPKFVDEILQGLSRVGCPALLKWNGDKVPTPDNVILESWVPQNDLLAHPNLKVFITHGGLHSTEEAIYHGVPVLCVPFFGDQNLNCQKAVSLGYGLILKPKELTALTLSEKLKELLSDSRFKENAMELSKRFKDRPLKPLESAVYWMDYVLRHRGADFLKGPKRNLYWFQIYYVDLICVIILAFVILKYVLNRIVGLCKSSDVGHKSVSKKIKKN